MSSKRLQGLIGLAVLLVGGWHAVRWWVSPERRINKNIKRIQELVSKAPGESDLIALAQAHNGAVAKPLFQITFSAYSMGRPAPCSR